MAVSVVLWHSQPIFGYFGLPGDVAVHLFFMISGFYMTLIINGKYNHPNGIKAFYVGRWFRLFPLFYLSVALTLFVHYLLPFMGVANTHRRGAVTRSHFPKVLPCSFRILP